MEESQQGEFHHFQLVDAEGHVPLSISVLVHYNYRDSPNSKPADPISADDVVNFHYALKGFDGNFTHAFKHTS